MSVFDQERQHDTVAATDSQVVGKAMGRRIMVHCNSLRCFSVDVITYEMNANKGNQPLYLNTNERTLP